MSLSVDVIMKSSAYEEVCHRLDSLTIVHVFIYQISTEDLCVK